MVLTRSQTKRHVNDVGDAATDLVQADSELQDRVQAMKVSLEHGALEDSRTSAMEFGVSKDAGSSKRRKQSKAKCREQKISNPKLWGTLPQELLQLVFARLPVDKISHLRFLNKEWNEAVTTTASPFWRDCDEAYPRMLAFVTRDREDAYWVRTLDMKRNIWYSNKIPVVGEVANCKCETGLVCCYKEEKSTTKGNEACSNLLHVSLMNPLTRGWQHLPTLSGVRQVKWVEVIDDPFCKAVTVADISAKNDNEVLHLYDFRKGKWRAAKSSLHQSSANKRWRQYDFENHAGMIYRGLSHAGLYHDMSSQIMNYVSYKDYCFVLRRRCSFLDVKPLQSTTYYIEEFCKVKGKDPGIKVKTNTHKCDPFEQFRNVPDSMELYACEGCLLVVAFGVGQHFEEELAWLYDLVTCKWSSLDLPQLPAYRKLERKPFEMFSRGLLLKPKWTF